ncbi:MAG: PadR family transcriptional regulator, partial [Promicromonosporaceae bacterium]|nr:PadR family transcriptional regulator [Promicromonosporaceae bacterium]
MPPVFAHGELRLYLLVLLADGPRHGYELISELSRRFGGTYRPSAGTVYPRLAKLEVEGLVRRDVSEEHSDGIIGRRAPYLLTDAGRAELDRRRDDIARLETSVADTVRQRADELRADVTGAMAGLRAEIAAAAAQV